MDLRLRWSSCLIEAPGAGPATSNLVSLTWTGYTGLTQTTPPVAIQCTRRAARPIGRVVHGQTGAPSPVVAPSPSNPHNRNPLGVLLLSCIDPMANDAHRVKPDSGGRPLSLIHLSEPTSPLYSAEAGVGV